MTQEGLQALCAFRGRLNERLMLIPEYRAIGVIDRTIKEISEILATTPEELDRAISAAAMPLRSMPDPAPLAEAAQARIASAIAEAIEGKTQTRMQRMPQPGAYTLVSAAS
jgi:hypothetical protein